MTDPEERATHAAWERELDAMEAYLDAHREAFSYRDVDRPPLRRPSPLDALGPLPDALRPRAEALLQATRVFEEELAEPRASVARALRHVRRARWARAGFSNARA